MVESFRARLAKAFDAGKNIPPPPSVQRLTSRLDALLNTRLDRRTFLQRTAVLTTGAGLGLATGARPAFAQLSPEAAELLTSGWGDVPFVGNEDPLSDYIVTLTDLKFKDIQSKEEIQGMSPIPTGTLLRKNGINVVDGPQFPRVGVTTTEGTDGYIAALDNNNTPDVGDDTSYVIPVRGLDEVSDELKIQIDNLTVLPDVQVSFDTTKLEDTFGSTGGLVNLPKVITEMWGAERVAQITPLQRVISTAVARFEELKEEQPDDTGAVRSNICEIFRGGGDNCAVSVEQFADGGFEVIAQLQHADDTVQQKRLFLVTRANLNKDGFYETKTAVATPEALIIAKGIEEVRRIAEATTAFSGETIAGEVLAIVDSVYLPGMPKERQFAQPIEGVGVQYTRRDIGGAIMYFANESSFWLPSLEGGNWTEFPILDEETLKKLGVTSQNELTTSVEATTYGDKMISYTFWYISENGERVKVNKHPFKEEWVTTSPGLGDAFQENLKMDFGIAAHNRDGVLGLPEDLNLIVQEASAISTEEAGEWRYLRKKETRFDEATQQWVCLDPVSNELKPISELKHEDVFDFTKLDEIVQLAVTTGKKIMFHHLIDTGMDRLPRWLNDVMKTDLAKIAALPSNDPQRIQIREKYIQLIRHHIQVLAGRYKGLIEQFTLANEFMPSTNPPRENHWAELIDSPEEGIDHLLVCAQAFREVNGDGQLILNDWTNEYPYPISEVIQKTDTLNQKGAKINGVGIQLHTSIRDTRITQGSIEQWLTQAANANLDVYVTELDFMHVFTSADQQKKAQIIQAIMSAAKNVAQRFGRPILRSITTWGYNNANSWLHVVLPTESGNYPLLFDKVDGEYVPDPAYNALLSAAQN